MKDIKAKDIMLVLECIDVNYETTDDDGLHEMYDAMINECCTCDCQCAACQCVEQAEALKEKDPIAYRCGFSDWLDSELTDERLFEIDDEYFTEGQLDELKDELVSAVENLFD